MSERLLLHLCVSCGIGRFSVYEIVAAFPFPKILKNTALLSHFLLVRLLYCICSLSFNLLVVLLAVPFFFFFKTVSYVYNTPCRTVFSQKALQPSDL